MSRIRQIEDQIAALRAELEPLKAAEKHSALEEFEANREQILKLAVQNKNLATIAGIPFSTESFFAALANGGTDYSPSYWQSSSAYC